MKRKPRTRLTAAIAAAALCAATAGAQSVAPSFWMVNPKFADSPALLLGVRGEYPVTDNWRAGGHLYSGNMDYGAGYEYRELDGELRISREWRWLDNAGLGCRLEKWGDGEQEFGPMIYAEIHEPFKDTAWGWHASASWMFFGLSGDYESEHLNAEIDLSWTKGDWQAQLGYRKKFYYGQEEDPAFSGPVISFAYNFGAGEKPRPKYTPPAPVKKPETQTGVKPAKDAAKPAPDKGKEKPYSEDDLYALVWKEKLMPKKTKSEKEQPVPQIRKPRPAYEPELDAPLGR